jgi:hypothetical protein
MTGFPDRLSVVPVSPYYNRSICERVGRVLVDGQHVVNCVAYDRIAGWAFGKDASGIWTPKVYGVVTVEGKTE